VGRHDWGDGGARGVVYMDGRAGKVEDRCTDRALNPLCSKQQVRCTRTAICKSPGGREEDSALFLSLSLSLSLSFGKSLSENNAENNFE